VVGVVVLVVVVVVVMVLLLLVVLVVMVVVVVWCGCVGGGGCNGGTLALVAHFELRSLGIMRPGRVSGNSHIRERDGYKSIL
jgi:hypothetical protein